MKQAVIVVAVLILCRSALADAKAAVAVHDKRLAAAAEIYKNSCLAAENKLIADLQAAKSSARDEASKAAIDGEIAAANARIAAITRANLPPEEAPASSLIIRLAKLLDENDNLRRSTALAAAAAPKKDVDANHVARIAKGMTWEEVVKLRGKPSDVSVDSEGNKRADWVILSRPTFDGAREVSPGGALVATYSVNFKNGVVDSFSATGTGVE